MSSTQRSCAPLHVAFLLFVSRRRFRLWVKKNCRGQCGNQVLFVVFLLETRVLRNSTMNLILSMHRLASKLTLAESRSCYAIALKLLKTTAKFTLAPWSVSCCLHRDCWKILDTDLYGALLNTLEKPIQTIKYIWATFFLIYKLLYSLDAYANAYACIRHHSFCLRETWIWTKTYADPTRHCNVTYAILREALPTRVPTRAYAPKLNCLRKANPV